EQMIGAIKEESVGYLYNLDVEVRPAPTEANAVTGVSVQAKGLVAPSTPQKLEYSAPSEGGGVEVRNQAGQIQTPRTPTRSATSPQQGQSRGAFGQAVPNDGSAAPQMNRAQRRAQERKGN